MTRLKKKLRREAPGIVTPIHPLSRLYEAIRRNGEPGTHSKTARLLAAGIPKIAKKVVEEAAEVAIGAVQGDRIGVVTETADLFYNIAVLLVEQEIGLDEVWAEMVRRERLYGIAAKLPKLPVLMEAVEANSQNA